MKRIVMLLSVLLLMLAGCGTKSSVDTGGFVLRQDTPYHAAVSFNTMLANGKFEAASRLLTTANAKELTAEDLAALHDTVRLQEMKLTRAEAGPEAGDLALVAVLRANTFAGLQEEVILYGLEILKGSGKKWYISRLMDEFSQEELRRLLDMAVTFQEELLEKDEFFTGLRLDQRESVRKQIIGMIDNNRLMLLEMDALEKQAREKYGIPEEEKKEEK